MTDPHVDPGIRWTFLTPSLLRPTGGDIALFELANATARSGRDTVQIVHVPFAGARVRSLGDLPWFAFDSAVEHQFASSLDAVDVPGGHVVLYTMKLLAAALAPGDEAAGLRLISALQHVPTPSWLPMLFVQGAGVFVPEVEQMGLRLPGPKVCVGTALVDLLVSRGVPAADVVHIPNGVDPDRFHVTQRVERRSQRVAMNFDPHPVKGGLEGVEAIDAVVRRLGVPATVFGTSSPERVLATDVTFVASPTQTTLARDIYNRSTTFLQPSRREGFGMCAVEAMACGCALVTTMNGGSSDYAHHDETAIVCGPSPGEMAEALVRVMSDDRLRLRIARNGTQFVERFRWTASAAQLHRLASERLGGPTNSPARSAEDG